MELERQEREQTGLSSLKAGFNRIHGYYLELSRSQADQAPGHYQRRQTLKHSERFTTPELKKLEDQVLGSRSRALARERRLYEELLELLRSHLPTLQETAAAASQLDVLACLAERAHTLDLCCPSFREEPGLFIEGGRHLTVEQTSSEPFISNAARLEEGRQMLIITGPNMGGKSTYMRQTALILILAHIGSHVPASQVQTGIFRRVFTRIGAADNLAQGQSTFMVEMSETAHILRNAEPESLILIDEIGRGTSTFDGLALAWATAICLGGKPKVFTMFATHYFELTALANQLQGVVNVHFDAAEHGQEVVFLHHVEEGPASRSYGIAVARLAGLPDQVLDLAQSKLVELEDTAEQRNPGQASSRQGNLLGTENAHEPLLRHLRSLDPDRLSPREALEAIYLLRKMLDSNRSG